MAASPRSTASPRNPWPAMPRLGVWQPTRDTVHMWTQIVGKTRLAAAAPVNHWWHVPFYVTSRGIYTSPMLSGARTFEVEFDFVDHHLMIRADDGTSRTMSLEPRTVAEFYQEYLRLLHELGVDVKIWPQPVEVETAVPFPMDREHAAYDGQAMQAFWRALVQADRVIKEFRGRFLGKASPVHFFWGGFDLACTRFSGRPAPSHPGGVPHVGDWVMREAYSHEVSSCGFWSGSRGLDEAAFYSYAYPEPEGFKQSTVTPSDAYYHQALGEFVLPYEAVRTSSTPDETLLGFLQSSYEAAADRARWDRRALERQMAVLSD